MHQLTHASVARGSRVAVARGSRVAIACDRRVHAAATLTELKAWCYDLEVEQVAVRRNNLVRSASAALFRLRSNELGAIQLEYTILLGLVGLSSAAAFVLLGVALVDSFGFVRGMLLTPFP